MSQLPSSSRYLRHRRSLRTVGFITVLAAALGLGLVPVSSADTGGDKKKLDANIAQLRAALAGTSQDLAHAVEQLRRTKAELPGARQALAVADAAQSAASRYNRDVARALATAEANAAKARAVLRQNARDTQAVQVQVGNLVRDDYQQGGISALAIALQATSLQDFTDRIMMMDTVMQVRRTTLHNLDVLRVQGQAALAHLMAVRHQVVVLKAKAEAGLAQATAARSTAAAAKTRLDLLYAVQARYQARVGARLATDTTHLDALQAQSQALTNLLAARAMTAHAGAGQAPSGGGPRQSMPQGGHTGFLSFPVNGPESSPFGMRFDPILHAWRLHAGLDFAVNCGTPVYAAAAGDVIMVTPESESGGYGNRLIIDNGLQRGIDLTTTYNHLSRFVVTSGPVARGQLVAYSGTTGFSTGCHLHFETREDGVPVNPLNWL